MIDRKGVFSFLAITFAITYAILNRHDLERIPLCTGREQLKAIENSQDLTGVSA